MSSSLQRAIYQEKADRYAHLIATWDADDGAAVYPLASREVLEDWNEPATDRVAALMALETALEQYEMGDTPVIPAMIKAALGYLKDARP